jgi:hypothetical protein
VAAWTRNCQCHLRCREDKQADVQSEIRCRAYGAEGGSKNGAGTGKEASNQGSELSGQEAAWDGRNRESDARMTR